jgi:hypothetical protein
VCQNICSPAPPAIYSIHCCPNCFSTSIPIWKYSLLAFGSYIRFFVFRCEWLVSYVFKNLLNLDLLELPEELPA